MSILKIKSGNFELELISDGNEVCEVKSPEHVSPQTAGKAVEVALIALALDSCCNSQGLHDEESGRITILPHHSEWSLKSFGLNQGIKRH